MYLARLVTRESACELGRNRPPSCGEGKGNAACSFYHKVAVCLVSCFYRKSGARTGRGMARYSA